MHRLAWTAASLAVLLLASTAPAADRPADAILADYDAVALPKSDPNDDSPDAVTRFRAAYNEADAKRADLALELFNADPDHPRLPEMLQSRWIRTMMDPSQAAATLAEIDRALPHLKKPGDHATAMNMRAIAAIHAHLKDPEAALPAVDDFLKVDPKSPRNATLLSAFAATIADSHPDLRLTLLKRLQADYPDSSQAKAAQASLALLDQIGKPLELTFTDAITGKPVNLQTTLKGQVVVLDFWATWCGPCKAEIPKMKELYAKYHDQGVEFIGVSLDAPEDEGGLSSLKSYVEKTGMPWLHYYQGQGFDSEFSTRMAVAAIPQVFLIDAEGRLAHINARGKLETLLPDYLARARTTSP
jgi:thiol-disulfide isomerase/thioredoxin